MSKISELKRFAGLINIAEESFLSKEDLEKIGNRVLLGYQEDERTMQHWLSEVKKVEELAALITKKKSYPLPNSANTRWPLITKAMYQFSSATSPEIFKDDKLVKGHVLGLNFDPEKEQKAKAVEEYMNYQLLEESDDFKLELDRLLNLLALVGFICMKSGYDPVRNQITTEVCDYKDLIINSEVKSLKDARRISHCIHLRLNDLIEKRNSGIFCSDPIDELIEAMEADQLDPQIDIIEQHTFLDLDDDDYAEPYIITVLKSNGKILRIAPRFTKDMVHGSDDKVKYIDAIQLFTDFHFLVSPKGKFQSVGFGILMLHLNEVINTVLNQLLDAGHLANMQGGYKDSRLKVIRSGDSLHNPGEWKDVKSVDGSITLKDGMFPINYKEPSNVLYQLLGLLIEAGKDLSSSSDVMSGNSTPENAKTGATQALIQEGRKVHASILIRVYRSLSNLIRVIFDLNAIYLDNEKAYQIVGDTKIIKREDFDIKRIKIIPTADPNLSSDSKNAARNQLLIAALQLPGVNKFEVTKLLLEGSDLGVPVEKVLLPPQSMNQPSPEMIQMQLEAQKISDQKASKQAELILRQKELEIEMYKVQCQCIELKAKAMLELSQADAQKDNSRFKDLELQLDIISKRLETTQAAAEFQQQNMMHQNEMGMRQQELDQNQQSLDQGNQNEPDNSNVESASGQQDSSGPDQGTQGS